jgi:hypothetical protein
VIDFSDYELNPLTGTLYKKGKRCGSRRSDGYYEMRIGNNKRIRVHRAIYMFVYGEIPETFVVDHKDNNPSNNQPWNLQAIPQSQNVYKEKSPKSGFHNIYIIEEGVYFVSVKHKGAQKRFKSLEKALEYRDYLLSLP